MGIGQWAILCIQRRSQIQGDPKHIGASKDQSKDREKKMGQAFLYYLHFVVCLYCLNSKRSNVASLSGRGPQGLVCSGAPES